MKENDAIRIGLVDLHCSHVMQFARRLNHVGIEAEQQVDGGKVVLAYQGVSKVTEKDKIEEYTRAVEHCGVSLVDNPEEMIGKIDAVFIEAQEGSVHLDRVRPFLEAGIPAFIDKPFACSVADAKAIAELAKKHSVLVFSSSSLRYATEVIEAQRAKEQIGEIVGAQTYSPAYLHSENPGMFHYGIHGVEMLYALMGPGCEAVWAVHTDVTDVVTGCWKDGRIGVVRAGRNGGMGYGFAFWGERGFHQSTVSVEYIYRNLLREILSAFRNNSHPLDIKETIEIIAFIEAANASAQSNGVKTVLNA